MLKTVFYVVFKRETVKAISLCIQHQNAKKQQPREGRKLENVIYDLADGNM